MNGSRSAEAPQVIDLQLSQANDMFEMPHTDLFSEYRNFRTGIDYCISELRSGRSHAPVRLEIELPPSMIDDDTGAMIKRTLHRYCDHRVRYNSREQRAIRLDGLSSLRVGLPIAVLGFLLAVLNARVFGLTGSPNVLLDTAGWVLAWVGLWYPLDTIFFSPLGYGRENHVLGLLRDADVVVRPRHETMAGRPGP